MPTKTMEDIWKLLQLSTKKTRQRSQIQCSQCGMTLEEFRRRGRLGCAADYELFQPHINELLERVHGAKTHEGRLPGISEDDLRKQQEVSDLQQRLEVAIRDEAYENAAQIRDELRSIEAASKE